MTIAQQLLASAQRMRLRGLDVPQTEIVEPGDCIKCDFAAMVVHTVASGLSDWKLGGRIA